MKLPPKKGDSASTGGTAGKVAAGAANAVSQPAAPPAPPPPPAYSNGGPRVGSITFGPVDVFDQVPKEGTDPFHLKGTKPAQTVNQKDNEVTIEPPVGDTVYLRLQAFIDGDATFVGAPIPTLASNSTNSYFVQTTSPGYGPQQPEGQLGPKPYVTIAEGGKEMTITLAFARSDNYSSPITTSRFTLAVYAKSTEGMWKGMLVERPTNPTNRLKITLTDPRSPKKSP